MLSELFETAWAWVNERTDAAKARILTDLSPNSRTRLVEHQGKIVEYKIDPPARKHAVFSLGGLIDAAERWGKTGVIWVGETCITLVADDAARLDTVAWGLSYSATWLELVKLSQHPKQDQASLVGLLKRELRKINGGVELLASVRNIKWKSQEAGNSTIEQGRDSLGNSLEAEISGAGDMPDLLTVPVNVFDAQSLAGIVRVVSLDLDVRPAEKCFYLRPMKDELAAAKETTLTEVAELVRAGLKEKKLTTPVFLGDSRV